MGREFDSVRSDDASGGPRELIWGRIIHGSDSFSAALIYRGERRIAASGKLFRRSAGVSPAILPMSATQEMAGETPRSDRRACRL
jgi:hypothetical protein